MRRLVGYVLTRLRTGFSVLLLEFEKKLVPLPKSGGVNPKVKGPIR